MKPWKPSPPIQNLLKKIVEIASPQQLVLCGSRARGDHQVNSDVDLVEFESLTKPYQDEIKKYGVILAQ